MGRIVDSLRALAFAWGAPGLFVVAFLDSSFLPLPGVADLLVIVMVTRRKEFILVYVAAAVAGSVAGCLVMHYLGKKGGDALIRKRFTGPTIDRAMASLQRHGVMSVLIPSLLPPPSPFKIFLLLAGAIGISATRFATAIAIGRIARYGILGWLAYQYGGRAQTYVRENGTSASLLAVAVIAGAFSIYLLIRKVAGRKNR